MSLAFPLLSRLSLLLSPSLLPPHLLLPGFLLSFPLDPLRITPPACSLVR